MPEIILNWMFRDVETGSHKCTTDWKASDCNYDVFLKYIGMPRENNQSDILKRL